MVNSECITIEGRIVEVRNGEKRINRSYTYGYMSLRVKVGFEHYSILVAASKLNKYGFLPRVGQWIRATGRLFPPEDGFYDPSIKYLSTIRHIEPPSEK